MPITRNHYDRYAAGQVVSELGWDRLEIGTPDAVSLTVYGDTLVCARLADNGTIARSFFTLRLSDNLTLTPKSYSQGLAVAGQ